MRDVDADIEQICRLRGGEMWTKVSRWLEAGLDSVPAADRKDRLKELVVEVVSSAASLGLHRR
jgi:hypothetical protein